MLRIDQAIIVEGKYDKIKLSSVIDGVIIVTNGFGIFKDKEKLELIRYYARTTGIVILTDSDNAGRRIRGYIKGAVPEGSVQNVFIPDVFGKEKRKEKPSAEGKLGVEGIDPDMLLESFRKAGIMPSQERTGSDITNLTLYELGLTGGPGSSQLRKRLQKKLGLPSLMSTTALIEVLRTMTNSAGLAKEVNSLKEEDNGI